MNKHIVHVSANEALIHCFVPPNILYASVYKVREVVDPTYVNDTGVEIKFFEFLDEPSQPIPKTHPLWVKSKAEGKNILMLEELSPLTIKPTQAAFAYIVDLDKGALLSTGCSVDLRSGKGYASPAVKCEMRTKVTAVAKQGEIRLSGAKRPPFKIKKRPSPIVQRPKVQFESKHNTLSLAVKIAGSDSVCAIYSS